MLHAVIMAGGSGTRFWPLSRESCPKQFLKVCGEETLLQQTFHRIEPLASTERIYVVTNPVMGEKSASQLPALPGKNLIIEPMARNTAPAIGLAAFRINRIDRDAVMVVLPADHYIKDREIFLNIIGMAHEAALKGFLVTLGITPTGPETGYGYILKTGEGSPLKGGGEVFPVKSFREKPDFKTAERYLREGNYYWNSGMFVWKVSTILEEIKTHMPPLYEKLSRMDQLPDGEEAGKERKKIFASISPDSIDYGVMEKSQKAGVIPANMEWHDVGSLSALGEINETDTRGNVVTGNIMGLENGNCIFYGGDRLVAVIGLKDMIVADTPDATLVCPKDRAQDIKKIAENLKKDKRLEFMGHIREEWPWGSLATLDRGSMHRVRKLEMNPGGFPDPHLHYNQDEHWTVVSGTAHVTKGEEVISVPVNGSIFIPRKTKHRLENRGKEKLVAVEVQTGENFGVEDV